LGFSKGGSGIQYLTNNNSTYTGITTIDAGTLNVSSISNGGLTANITTTLGGTSATLSSIVGTLVIGQIYTVDSANVPIGTTFTYTGSPTVTLTSAATAAGTNVGADVGVASALGFATNAAGNLIFGGALNGGAVLQYNATTGPVSTDRLFTIGDNSTTNTGNGLSGSISGDTATLDSSSSVAADTVSFTNTGAIAFQNTAYTHNLTLTGSNTGTQAGVNTFAPLLGDMAGGQSTSLNKTGTGTWALTNNNTYSGGTIISAGKLYVNNGGGASYSPPTTSALRPITATNSGSGTGTGAVTVLSGGTLAGSGTITPTGGAGVTVQTGGTLASGGLQSGTSAGAGLTLSNTEASSTLLSLQGGVTLSFDLGSTVNNAGAALTLMATPIRIRLT
jgi:fibronectin-binding autotransporter adhesin